MKNMKPGDNNSLKDALAARIAATIVSGQLKLSRRLSQWDRKLNREQRKWLFILFVGIAGTYCMSLFIGGLWGNGKPAGQMIANPPFIPADSTGYNYMQLPVPGRTIVENEHNKNQKQQ